jgi:hypothetical protein
MQSQSITPQQYVASLTEDRKKAVSELRKAIMDNLPTGFEETISYGMIGYVVPFSMYPQGYHCNPELPLPFLSIASQKNFVALYHMGLYADPQLMEWFINEYPKHSKRKLDMGKSCIRFKKVDEIPLKLIGELVSKISAADWIRIYEKAFKK